MALEWFISQKIFSSESRISSTKCVRMWGKFNDVIFVAGTNDSKKITQTFFLSAIILRFTNFAEYRQMFVHQIEFLFFLVLFFFCSFFSIIYSLSLSPRLNLYRYVCFHLDAYSSILFVFCRSFGARFMDS